jgi:hypothetical protein
MDSGTRKRLDMIHRVWALSTAHQATIRGYVEAVQRMGERLARADALVLQAEAAEREADALVARKDELRRVIGEDYLVHLMRIARVSLPEDPELRRRFRMPKSGANQQKFVATTRAILAEAASRKELFIAEGMAESFVEDLEALIGQYIQAVDQKTLGSARKVGAGAELKAITKELMALVRRVDGINRKRWQQNPELLAAWVSAKDVSWPHAAPPALKRPGTAEGGKETVA